ncbi:MAG: tetratricopeptide repeat protein [Clostridia bacterium]|nr:tetratricopeptide repeat protein [Clostridia bacterium]MBQ6938065.1 tetratricopeptide repeat protein [Clostridia bacterium]
MKNLLYVVAFFGAFWLIGQYFGALVAFAALLIVVAVLLWNRRALILTQLASQAYYIKGNVEKGEKLYQKAYKTGLMNAQAKISYSSFCLRENRFDKGRRLLNEVINSNRTTTEDKINAKHNLAVLTWKEGNLEEAIKIATIVHKQMPSTNTYGTLGVLLLENAKKEKNYTETLEFLLEAYEYNEDDKTIADNLGELYYITGQYVKAKEIYSKLLEKQLFTPMPYYNYALVLKNMGDTDGARENFEKALTCRFTSVLTVTKEMIRQELDNLNQ